MKKQSIALFVLVVLLLTCALTPVTAFADETETEFSGSRTLVLTADGSDLNNFLSGGRESLDLMLRYSAPGWLTYSLKSQGRDVILTIGFTFTSLDEYTARLSALLTRTPNVLYTYYNGTVLTEDCAPIELLNFLAAAMDLTASETTWSLDQLFHVTANTLVLGTETYEFGEGPVQITPQANGTILLQELNVQTVETDDGALNRTITVKAGSTGFDKAQWDTLLQRFQETGETESHSNTGGQIATVTFQAADHQSLAQLTGYCLNTAVSLAQTVTDITGFTMTVHRTELFLLEGLMADEGIFCYTYDHPASCQELAALSESTTVSGSTLTATGQSCIQSTFQQTFGLSKIAVHTDYSNLFGKIRRTITLTVPAKTAPLFHPVLKEELTKRLIPGTSLDIYDQEGTRYYTLQFSSWFDSDIAEFTQSILGISTYDRTDSWVPYGESSLSESISSDRLLSAMAPADAFEISYLFSSLSNVTVEDETALQDGATVTFSGTKTSLSYRHLHLGKLIPELLAVILVLLLILIPIVRLCRRIKSTPKAKPAKTTPKKPTEKRTANPIGKPVEAPIEKPIVEPAEAHKEAPTESTAEKPIDDPVEAATEQPEEQSNVKTPRFCKKCGNAITPGTRFCKNCGTPIESQ